MDSFQMITKTQLRHPTAVTVKAGPWPKSLYPTAGNAQRWWMHTGPSTCEQRPQCAITVRPPSD